MLKCGSAGFSRNDCTFYFLLTIFQLGREKFHKSQHFDYSNGVAMMVGAEKPGIGGELLLGQSTRPKYSLFPKREGSDAPAWVAFNKQVCHHYEGL